MRQYSPLQNGIPTTQRHVYYREHAPEGVINDIVHCFWTLKTTQDLSQNFIYSVMPDACIDIVFDTSGSTKPIMMTPHLRIDTIDLGTAFHFMGVRFKPGVIQKNVVDIHTIIGKQMEIERIGEIRLGAVVEKLKRSTNKDEQVAVLSTLAEHIQDSRIATKNYLIERALANFASGMSLDEVARKAGYSSRQLRRIVYDQTGFSPIQLQRIVRFQDALSSSGVSLRFADQSHLIKEFKAITGMSYKSFTGTFT